MMGHLLIVAKQRYLSQECRNTFWFGGGDAIMANAQAICDGIRLAWFDNLYARLNNNWTLYEFDVYDKTVPSVPGLQYGMTLGPLIGQVGTDGLPTQIAMLVTFKAQVAPPNTNRKYLTGFPEVATVNGQFTTLDTTAANAWAADMLDLGTTLVLGIVMEVVSLALDGTVIGGNPLEYADSRPIPATQRRRRIGVGI